MGDASEHERHTTRLSVLLNRKGGLACHRSRQEARLGVGRDRGGCHESQPHSRRIDSLHEMFTLERSFGADLKAVDVLPTLKISNRPLNHQYRYEDGRRWENA